MVAQTCSSLWYFNLYFVRISTGNIKFFTVSFRPAFLSTVGSLGLVFLLFSQRVYGSVYSFAGQQLD